MRGFFPNYYNVPQWSSIKYEQYFLPTYQINIIEILLDFNLKVWYFWAFLHVKVVPVLMDTRWRCFSGLKSHHILVN